MRNGKVSKIVIEMEDSGNGVSVNRHTYFTGYEQDGNMHTTTWVYENELPDLVHRWVAEELRGRGWSIPRQASPTYDPGDE